nr:GNAT family N-acetyltransferase [Krasilnikovia cinnamomea]
MPRLETRRRACGLYSHIRTEHALTVGWVDVTDDLNSAAFWYPLAEVSELWVPSSDTRLGLVCGQFMHRFVALDEAMRRHHPAGNPHHYLAFLAVRPGLQRCGLGTSLLRHHHAYLDAENISAYVEAIDPAGRALFHRHDYQDRHGFQVPDGPQLCPMWRAPQPDGGAADSAKN